MKFNKKSLVFIILIVSSISVLGLNPTGITLILTAGSGTTPTDIDLVVGARVTIDDCTYVSGDWIIDDGSNCTLDTITDIGDNHFSLISGSVKIESTGGIKANSGCFNNMQPFFVDTGGILVCVPGD